ncbi:hypothetical protein SUGI_0549770 [Cryptomeria japonica]|nr:hypothetical protein SUGI_0549770 [Cryptomeria japonica]
MRSDVFVACRDGDRSSIQIFYWENPGLLQELAFEENTILHIAAMEGHSEIVSWVLTYLSGYCFLTKSRNADKNTALHEGAKGGNAEVVRTLLAYKKSAASKRNQFGETALVIASDNGHVEAVRLLMEATPWFMTLWPRNDHQTCLHVAAYEGYLDVVKLILGRFSYWDVVHLVCLVHDVHGATSFHIAVHGRHPDIVNEIMKTNLKSWWCRHWFDNNLMIKKDELGRCPIHVAIMKGCLEIVERFIFVMPDCVEIRSGDLKTPLHFAVEYNKSDLVEKLLSPLSPTKVAKLVDAVNNEGQSALNIAGRLQSDKNPNFSRIERILSHSFIWHSKALRQQDQHRSQNNNNEDTVMPMDTLVASLVASITFGTIGHHMDI